MQETDNYGKIEHNRRLSESEIERINTLLMKDQRVEIIPTKKGIMIFRIRRDEIKS